MTYRQFLKSREEIKKMSIDLYADMGMGDEAEDQAMKEWPEFFEVDNIPPVRKSELKSKPRLNNF